MKNIKILKRTVNSVPSSQLNKTVFDYYVDNNPVDDTEVNTAFLEVLNLVLNPDEENYDLKGDWNISAVTVGGSVQLPSTFINTYTGIRYYWKINEPTLITAAQPAQLNGFTGKTYKGVYDMMLNRWNYTETTNLLEVAYAEFLDPGFPPEIVDIEVVGGTPRVLAVFDTVPPSYQPVTGSIVGTHGQDENGAFRPINFWREEIPGELLSGTPEAIYTDAITGFNFSASSVGLKIDNDGKPDPTLRPVDLTNCLSFIGLKFRNRNDGQAEVDV